MVDQLAGQLAVEVEAAEPAGEGFQFRVGAAVPRVASPMTGFAHHLCAMLFGDAFLHVVGP